MSELEKIKAKSFPEATAKLQEGFSFSEQTADQ